MTDELRERWRNQLEEPPIDPDFPIIDAHHHLIPYPPRPRLERYMPDDLFADLRGSGHRVIATVHVDAYSNYRTTGPDHLRVVGETEYVDAVALEAQGLGGKVRGACSAIVGNADLLMGAVVAEVLDAHIAASPRLTGVRRMTIYDPDLPALLPSHSYGPGLLLEPAFHEGMREVARRGLSFDAGIMQSQFADLLAFARIFPDATIVLDHIGTPLAIGRYSNRPADAFAEWRTGMAEIARCENVLVKIGGLNMPFTGLGVGNEASRPLSSQHMANRQRDHILNTIDLFGPDRCMFESNFPVDKWYTSYAMLWNSFKKITINFSDADKAALYYGTAARAYRIDLPAFMSSAPASE